MSRHRHAGLTFGWPPFSFLWHVGSDFSACNEKVVRYTGWSRSDHHSHHLGQWWSAFGHGWNWFLSIVVIFRFENEKSNNRAGKWRISLFFSHAIKMIYRRKKNCKEIIATIVKNFAIHFDRIEIRIIKQFEWIDLKTLIFSLSCFLSTIFSFLSKIFSNQENWIIKVNKFSKIFKERKKQEEIVRKKRENNIVFIPLRPSPIKSVPWTVKRNN